jgi:hypothetical protein
VPVPLLLEQAPRVTAARVAAQAETARVLLLFMNGAFSFSRGTAPNSIIEVTGRA